mgnify:FL=1
MTKKLIQKQKEDLLKNLKALDRLHAEISAIPITNNNIQVIETLMALDRKIQKHTFFPEVM